MARRITKTLIGKNTFDYSDGFNTVRVTNFGFRRGGWRVIPSWGDRREQQIPQGKAEAITTARALLGQQEAI